MATPTITAADLVLPASSQKATNDFSWLRGANYVPSYARNDLQTWLDYDPAVVDRELAYAARLRLNCVRVFLQAAVYEREPKRFLDNLENFLNLCDRHRLQMMPVIFDSCFGEFPDLDKYRAKDWMACPGQHRLGPEHWPAMEKFVLDVVGRHRDDRRVIMWDVMNEPTCTSFNQPEHKTVIWTFLGHFLDFVRTQDANHPRCVGVETSALLTRIADKVDVLCFHNYQKNLREDISGVRELGRKLGKPFIINEVVMRPQQPYDFAMPILRQEKIGWVFWELMFGKTQFTREANPIQGLVYPDGTCRDAREVAAVMDTSLEEAKSLFPQRRWPAEQTAASADNSKPLSKPGLPAHAEDGIKFSDGWTRWTGVGPLKNRLHYARQAGATAVWEAKAGPVVLIHKAGPDCGLALALIDGERAPRAQLDTFSPSVDWNRRVILATNLPPGRHTVTIVALGLKNEKSSDSYVQIVDSE